MSKRTTYEPGPATGAEIRQQGEQWTLVLVRDLRHPPPKVWRALTEPEQLREWAPFDADGNLATVGPVRLSTVGTPAPQVSESRVLRAQPHRLLELRWGSQELRWELEPLEGGGTRLTLWHNIPRAYISMGAAGWHICLDVLQHVLEGEPIGRIVGPQALAFPGWQRLHAEYTQQFDLRSMPSPSPRPPGKTP